MKKRIVLKNDIALKDFICELVDREVEFSVVLTQLAQLVHNTTGWEVRFTDQGGMPEVDISDVLLLTTEE